MEDSIKKVTFLAEGFYNRYCDKFIRNEVNLFIDKKSGKIVYLTTQVYQRTLNKEFYDNKWNEVPFILGPKDDIIGYIKKSKFTQDIILDDLEDLGSMLCEEERNKLKEIFDNRIEERINELESSLRLKLKKF